MNRLAFFVSGTGTNMENLVGEIQAGRISAEAALVISDNPEAEAIAKAGNLGVPVRVVDREKFSSKQEFEREISAHLAAYRVDWLVLAGFMRILSPDFVRVWWGKIVNIHPALLPAFPGAHAIRDAFDAKVRQTGVTVHFVDAGVDTGPVILQRKVPIDPDDTLDALETRIHAVEYQLYPEALRLVLAGKVTLPKKVEK